LGEDKKMSLYNEKVMSHFRNPHNMGSIENPDGVGKVGNVICGDVMHLYIKVKKRSDGEDVIEDIKYETFGCVAAISTSSMVTDLAKGMTIKEAMEIDKNSIAKSLGGLPKIKLHCSILAADALAESIYDYLNKNKKEIPNELQRRHDKIIKEKEILEKRYSKWID